MKFRKTISAIAALAMSVSCLAGLTITANAADGATVINYIGSESAAETFDGYTGYNGSVDADNENAPRASWSNVPSASSGNNSALGVENVTYVAPPAVGEAASTYPTYVNGSTLAMNRRGNGTSVGTLTFSDMLTKGNIYFDSDVAKTNDKSNANLYGEIYFANSDGDKVLTIAIPSNNNPTAFTVTGSESKTTTGTYKSRVAGSGQGFHVSVTIDLDADTASVKFDFINAADGDKRAEETVNVSITDTDISSFNLSASGTSSQNNRLHIDNTKLYAKATLPNTPYTIKYMTNASDDTTVVKTDSSRKGFAGEAPTFSTATFEVENGNAVDRYYYVSDDSEGKTIAADGSTVIKVLVRHGVVSNYTVNAVTGTDNTVLKAIKTGTAQEGDKVGVAFSHIILKDGVIYEAPAISQVYALSFDMGDEAVTKTIEYTAQEGNNNIFFTEGEDIEGVSVFSSGNIEARSSNRAGAYAAEDTKVTTLEPGKYILHAVTSGNATSNEIFTIKAGTYVIKDAANKRPSTDGNWTDFTSTEFDVKDTVDLTFSGGGAGSTPRVLDYLYVEKTGDIAHDVTIDAKKATIAATDATTGMVGAPTFESVKENYDFENKKIVSVTVAAPTAEDKATIPVVTIGDTEYKLTAEEWTAVSDADGLSYYMEFVKRADADWKTFGDVKVTFGTGESATTKTIDLTAAN